MFHRHGMPPWVANLARELDCLLKLDARGRVVARPVEKLTQLEACLCVGACAPDPAWVMERALQRRDRLASHAAAEPEDTQRAGEP